MVPEEAYCRPEQVVNFKANRHYLHSKNTRALYLHWNAVPDLIRLGNTISPHKE